MIAKLYGGAYAYGKTAVAAGYDAAGVGAMIRRKPRSDWLALMPNAHEGYVSWEKFEAIRKMISGNIPTSRHHGAPKHGETATLYWQDYFAVPDAGAN
jgi:hypothetical protein